MTSSASDLAAPLLHVERLSKDYPGVRALNDVTLSVRAGEIVGLVGKNGAGKSTLVKVLAGLVKIDSGMILINQQEVSIHSPYISSKLGLGFVHQELSLVPALSVAENVFLGIGYPTWGPFLRWRELRRQTNTVLLPLGSDIRADDIVKLLSPVQQRIVMLAHGLAHEARLVLLDEPSSSLTEHEITRLHSLLRQLASRGVAVVYVSHRLDEVLALTDRVVVMRDGGVIGDFKTTDLDRGRLIELITGEAQAIRSTPRLSRTSGFQDRESSGTGLEVENLRCLPRIKGVSFLAASGEILGIAGLTASGRSTLLRCLFGTQKANSGQVLLNKKAIPLGSSTRAIKAGIVLVPEDRRKQGNFLADPIYRNISIASLRKYRPIRWIAVPSVGRERAGALRSIEELSIKVGSVNASVQTLSGGNQQKVVLAKWLTRGADVFLFDEPTVGIDVGAKSDFFQLVAELAKEGKVCVVVSSEFSDLIDLCDRILVLRDGQIADEFERGVTEAQLVASCYAV